MADESSRNKQPDIGQSPKFIGGIRIGQKGMEGRKNLDLGINKERPIYGNKEKKS